MGCSRLWTTVLGCRIGSAYLPPWGRTTSSGGPPSAGHGPPASRREGEPAGAAEDASGPALVDPPQELREADRPAPRDRPVVGQPAPIAPLVSGQTKSRWMRSFSHWWCCRQRLRRCCRPTWSLTRSTGCSASCGKMAGSQWMSFTSCRRHQGARGAALVTAAIGGQAARERHVDRAPQEWIDQLVSLGIPPTQHERAGEWVLAAWQFAQGISPWDGWRDILRLLGQFQELRRLTPLGPPPSQWDQVRKVAAGRPPPRAAPAGRPAILELRHDPKMLSRIRACCPRRRQRRSTKKPRHTPQKPRT